MSDCFDHLTDAYESYDRSLEDLSDKQLKCNPWAKPSYNPLYYHKKLKFQETVVETDLAYLLRLKGSKGVWVPKSICRNKAKHSVMVHKATYGKCTKVQIA